MDFDGLHHTGLPVGPKIDLPDELVGAQFGERVALQLAGFINEDLREIAARRKTLLPAILFRSG